MEIKFIASGNHVFNVREKPVPAYQMVPEWWRDMDMHIYKTFDLNPYPSVTAKKCFPLLDGITSGYIITLWSDILVSNDDNGNKIIKWLVSHQVADQWSPLQVSSYEIPDGFSNDVFKYFHGWIIKTPKNYSCLITHPIGYPNLPIKSLTGVVDTDMLETHINVPFVIKKDFEGIIEKGTPMFQIIPFKRDSWEMKTECITQEETNFRYDKLYSTIKSAYGKKLRAKKEYK